MGNDCLEIPEFLRRQTCSCSMKTQLAGDGCSICNPVYARRFLPDLHLNLIGEYFHQIKHGIKIYEYRERTPYWKKRLEGKEFNKIYIKLGYPKKDDKEKIIIRPWKGYIKTHLKHEHFFNGEWLVDVYAIIVN